MNRPDGIDVYYGPSLVAVDADGKYVVRGASDRLYRISEDLYAVIGGADASPRSVSGSEIEQVGASVGELLQAGLITSELGVRKHRRVSRVAGGWKLHVFDPGRVSHALARIPLIPASTGAILLATLGFIVASFALVPGAITNLRDVTGLRLSEIVLIGLIQWLALLIHELMHAAVLSKNGRKPRSIGFMLLYGYPTLYCDISEAWALPRARRAAVALAGVLAQSLVAFLLLTIPATAAQLSGLALLGAAFVNYIPFVRFDGYVALAGLRDEPYLRRNSMQAARDMYYAGNPPAETWRGFYGTLCCLFPWILVFLLLLNFGANSGPLGPVRLSEIFGLGFTLAAIGRVLWLTSSSSRKLLALPIAASVVAAAVFGGAYIANSGASATFVALDRHTLCLPVEGSKSGMTSGTKMAILWSPLGSAAARSFAVEVTPQRIRKSVDASAIVPGLMVGATTTVICQIARVDDGVQGLTPSSSGFIEEDK